MNLLGVYGIDFLLGCNVQLSDQNPLEAHEFSSVLQYACLNGYE